MFRGWPIVDAQIRWIPVRPFIRNRQGIGTAARGVTDMVSGAAGTGTRTRASHRNMRGNLRNAALLTRGSNDVSRVRL